MNNKEQRIAESYLAKADPVLGGLLQKQSLSVRERPHDYFAALCRSIIGQQVSVVAAKAIYGRLEIATDLQPAKVLALLDDDVKRIGLSKQKAAYIRDLAMHFHKNPDVYNHLESQSDDDIIKELTDVKGIGVWTAQMFLMFTLNRPDVFAPDDAGLQKAMMSLYGWETLPSKAELEKVAEKWKPYRTIACLHLWESLNNKPA